MTTPTFTAAVRERSDGAVDLICPDCGELIATVPSRRAACFSTPIVAAHKTSCGELSHPQTMENDAYAIPAPA